VGSMCVSVVKVVAMAMGKEEREPLRCVVVGVGVTCKRVVRRYRNFNRQPVCCCFSAASGAGVRHPPELLVGARSVLRKVSVEARALACPRRPPPCPVARSQRDHPVRANGR